MVVATSGYEQRESDQQRLVRESLDIPSFRCLDRTFSVLSDVETPQGILAVVRQPRWNQDELFDQPRLFGLYGERLQDPANVGAIIRTAAALNVDALWLTLESADVYNPKVVRATSGALLSLPIFVVRDATVFARQNCAMYTAEAGGRGMVEMETIRDVPKRLIIALGNESRGLAAQTIRQAVRRFTIPLSRQVESLNVAATAAIALHYFGRLPRKS
jgi:RNA methyltransferase, TrmH family